MTAIRDQLEIRQQLEAYRKENELMRLMGTREGFFRHYFQELGAKENGKDKHRTMVECFNYVNEQYYDLYGEYKYSSYNSFRWSLNNQNKQ